ncbi:MAG: hypothetical protein ABH889_02470 [Candidatus Portnoybacteria bacterium]
MLTWIVTIILALTALAGWLFLKRDPDRYIHEQKSPINIFFKWGRFWHHVFKVIIIVFSMLAVFSLYNYFLKASSVFSLTVAVIAGVVLSAGKELLDKAITSDDIIVSVLGIALGLFIVILIIF